MRADFLARERRAARRRILFVVGGAMLAIGAGLAVVRHFEGSAAPARAATAGAAPVLPLPVAVATGPAPVTSPSPVSSSGGLKTRPLSTWLAEVARAAGRDLVISPDLRGDLTASETSNLDWRQRLDAYSRVFGFEFAVRDGLIEVTKRDATVREAPSGRESAQAEDGEPSRDAAPPVSAPIEPAPHTRVVHLAYSAAKDTAAVLGPTGKTLEVGVAADPSTNSLVLSGQPAPMSRVLAVLRELDRPRRRILLDAKIVEVTRSARLDLGVEWKVTGTKVGGDVKFPPPVSDAGSAALLIATGGASALDARISALEADGRLHVVSRPSVVMMEGSPALIESARILRIRLPSRGAVVGEEVVESPSSGRATEEIPVGVRLEVTPAIRGGGRVLLRIKAKSSSLGAPLPPDDIPEELSRMVDAEVLVTSGETAVLGGLTRESGTKSGSGVPGLRRVPLAGALFGKKSDEKEEEELMVIVTPRVLE